jgi:hypothetical protein
VGPVYGTFRDSIVASIPACHAGDRGSIPRRGVFFAFLPVDGYPGQTTSVVAGRRSLILCFTTLLIITTTLPMRVIFTSVLFALAVSFDVDVASAFQARPLPHHPTATVQHLERPSTPPSSFSHRPHIQHRSSLRTITLYASSNDDKEKKAKVPFFSRAMKKILRKKDDAASLPPLQSPPPLQPPQTAPKTPSIESKAAQLMTLAEKTRLEAEKMDLILTLKKIEALERKISALDKHPDWRQDIIDDSQVLLRKLKPSISSQSAPTSTTTTISNEELQRRVEKFLKSSREEQEYLVSSAGFADESNVTAIVLKLDEYEQKTQQQTDNLNDLASNNDTKPLLSEDKKGEAVEGFEKLPQQLRDAMARTVGMSDGTNATAVIDQLFAENRLFESGDNETFQFSTTIKSDDFEDIFVDLQFEEKNAFVSTLFPEVTRKEPLNETYMDALYSEVLGVDTFNPNGKPEAVPGGYIVRGIGKVKANDGEDYGDSLVKALDAKIAQSSLRDKIQCCYILDPTPPSGEEILNEEDESPLLLVTNHDLSPSTDVFVKTSVTLIGLASIAFVSLDSFSFNDEVLNQISVSANAGKDLTWLYALALPLALSTLTIQLIHEFGHLIVAVKDGIDIGFPTLVPGFQFGLSGAITPIKSPPKSIKSLFDFAIAGPLLGLVASMVLLYVGLEMTVFMDTAAREQLPSIPVQLLRSSTLGGGIVDYLLGDGILSSPDPSEMIKLHPFAIAGFGGLVTNALR